jgi:hypothetical protein
MLSERAESSCGLANVALAQYREQRVASAQRSRRPTLIARRERQVASLTDRFRSYDALTRLVAIAEEFSVSRFIEASEARLPDDPFVELLWDAELDRAGDTWPKRTAAWETYHAVKLSSFPSHNALQGFIEARNAIAHGLGELTRRQLRQRTRTAGRLKNAGIPIQGNALGVSADNVEVCAEVVKSFVVWLDGQPA